MASKKLQGFNERLWFVLGDRKKHHFGPALGWTDSLTGRIFAGEQLPNAVYLAALTRFERVNINWLLNGEGAPYEVTPPPDPRDLPADGSRYYLFGRPDGVHPPLVRVRPAPDPALLPLVTVYSGLAADVLRLVEGLDWRGESICLVPDHEDQAARLRAGWLGNHALIDEGRGLLEGELSTFSLPPSTLADDAALSADEWDWLMSYRALPDEQRAALWQVMRGLRGSTAG